MGYRKVDGKFWTDPVVKKLTCDEKLLFLYCITSPRTHYSGIYYNPLPMIQYETGIDLKGLRKAFGTLRKGLMVYFSEDTGVVFVKNLIKFQKLNANETKGVFNHLPEIQDKEILSIFLDTYPEFSGSNKEPYLTLPKPFLNPLLTLPKPLPNTSEDTETETETETETDNIISAVEFLELFHETCSNLPRVRRLSAKRERGLLDLRKELKTKDATKGFLHMLKKCDWVRSDTGKTWKADIDWFVKEDNWLRVLEGRYEDGSQPTTADPKAVDDKFAGIIKEVAEGRMSKDELKTMVNKTILDSPKVGRELAGRLKQEESIVTLLWS